MSDELLIDARGACETWRLHRPARKNALSLALIDALDAAREAAVARGATVVVLTGHPADGTFSAGFDLGDLARLHASGASTSEAASPLHALFARLETAPFTLITAINGAAIGGGCELALLGDVRIMHPRATLLLPPSRLGITYPRDGLARLAASLGPSLLGAMLATAMPLSASRLHAAGVVSSLDDDPVAEAERIAAEISALPATARASNRDVLRSVARRLFWPRAAATR
jgi:enoyl-CoA hydratase/carnithine racemase